MESFEELKQGYYFMAQNLSANLGSDRAFFDFLNNVNKNEEIRLKNEHLKQINDAIDEFQTSINEHPYKNLGINQLKGFVSEEWHAGTFNVNAIKQKSESRAWTLQDTEYGSVDIDTNFGKQYSSKNYNTPNKSENAQAILDLDNRKPKYHGQERLVPKDQLAQAKKNAQDNYIKNLNKRPDVAKAHLETKEHLVSKISDDKGVESNDLSTKDSLKIAKAMKRGKFNPEKHGVYREELLEEARVDYIDSALNSGLTAATITAIMQLVPELYKTIDYLTKNGEIDIKEVKTSSKRVISTSGESFLRGSIAYLVEYANQKGFFGEFVKNIEPTIIGVLVNIIYSTIKDSILVAAGKISAREMGDRFIDSVFVSSGYLIGMKVGGPIGQSLAPNLPIIGYAIGSLIGCSIAVVYKIGKKQFISFCVDTGFACFGLVEQNYEIPEEVLAKMGVHTIPVSRIEVSKTIVNNINIVSHLDAVEYETIDLTVLKRGIIGINKVGYVPA